MFSLSPCFLLFDVYLLKIDPILSGFKVVLPPPPRGEAPDPELIDLFSSRSYPLSHLGITKGAHQTLHSQALFPKRF